jgi:putative peptide zinc metalloprotease protein
VAVPQNLSAAVNYACVQCVTYALARQLVVSVDGPLDDQASQQLAAVWAQLRTFGEHLQDVPLADLQARLTDFEAQILSIVRQDAGGGGAPAGSSAVPTDSSGSAAPDTAGGSTAASGSSVDSSTDAPAATSSEAAPTSAAAATTSESAPASSTDVAGTTDTAAPTG